jgi:hypothetical protein
MDDHERATDAASHVVAMKGLVGKADDPDMDRPPSTNADESRHDGGAVRWYRTTRHTCIPPSCAF